MIEKEMHPIYTDIKKELTVPVVLIIFNRPDVTQIVFNEVRKAQPKKLFVIADGPRTLDELEKCQATRDIINQVDWDCEVFKNFSEINLSSPIRCSTGITWVFSQVEEAIILEDDCLPCESFFSYCEELLEHYRHDKRVMHISGNNFQFGQQRTEYSYYFSKYNHNWGWATWRRAWKYFDFNLISWPSIKKEDLLDHIYESKVDKKYWSLIFDKCFSKEKRHWDYSWTFACWTQGGLSILPNKNLVSNIGFGPDATHTRNQDSKLAQLQSHDIWNISHPPFIVRHKEADIYTFNTVFNSSHRDFLATLKRIPSKIVELLD